MEKRNGSAGGKASTVEAEIKRMVKRIVAGFQPNQIILFGSHARGNAGPDSDVDLLVVMPVEGSKHEKQLEVRMALGRLTIPVDIILSRPEDFEWRKDYVGTIEHPAWREGRVLYTAR